MIIDDKLYLEPETIEKMNLYADAGLLNVSYHPTIEGLRIFNYTKKAQFEKHWDRITIMCRGLVVDKHNRVVIHCPEKFFNDIEPEAPDTSNWEHISILEKLDGYYISVRKDSEYGLIVTSRGSFDNKYVEAAKELLPPLKKIDADKDYFCELCQNFAGDESLIVTQHETPRLVLWSVNGVPPSTIYWHERGWDVAKEMSLKQAEKYMEQDVEGIVIFDWDTCERVKTKTKWYLSAHRLISGFTKKNIFEYWTRGEKVEDIADLPEEHIALAREWEESFNQMYAGEYVYPAKTVAEQWKNKSDKDFALGYNESNDLKKIVFAIRKGQDYRDIVYRMMKKRLTD